VISDTSRHFSFTRFHILSCGSLS